MKDSLNPNTRNNTCLRINYYTLLIISILFYVESIYALWITCIQSAEFGLSGMTAFIIWFYHIVAVIILTIVSSIIFLIELCLRYVFKKSAYIGLNKMLTAILIGGFIMPVLTVFIVPIIGLVFDITSGRVGVMELLPFQSKINNISQEELDKINNKPYKSYEELKTEREATPSPQEKQVIFYSEQITPKGIEKSVILKPDKNGTSFP